MEDRSDSGTVCLKVKLSLLASVAYISTIVSWIMHVLLSTHLHQALQPLQPMKCTEMYAQCMSLTHSGYDSTYKKPSLWQQCDNRARRGFRSEIARSDLPRRFRGLNSCLANSVLYGMNPLVGWQYLGGV